MQTATASVSNLENNYITTDVRVIFNSGSQRTYMNEVLCEKLKFPFIRSERIIVKTFGNNDFKTRDVNVVLIKFCTEHNNFFVKAICSLVICVDLTNQNCKFVSKRYCHLQGLNLDKVLMVPKLAKYLLVLFATLNLLREKLLMVNLVNQSL